MTALDLINIYISFFEKRGHKRIPNAPLVPENDPTTLFTSSGMQPLVPYLLGEPHPQGKRLVNVQNCFRAQDIEEVGDNRHTTFFRMLGNWSLGDYFKDEQLPWFFEFLTKELKIDPKRLYVSVFERMPRLSAPLAGELGFASVPKDEESANIWKSLFEGVGLDPKNRIFYYEADKNWWSRTGLPQDMPEGEPGGPDSEVFYEFTKVEHNPKYGKKCHPNCNCGRFLEIGNSVFMEYKKQSDRFVKLPQKNVDFGGGLERILAVIEEKSDIFKTSLFSPIVEMIEKITSKNYQEHAKEIRIIVDHFLAATFMTASSVVPSNKEQGYILRRLIRRGLDNFYKLEGQDLSLVIGSIVKQYLDTDPPLQTSFEKIKDVILSEEKIYNQTLGRAKEYILKKYKKIGDELMGVTEISSEDAFLLYSTHGLSPTQIKNLGFIFNDLEFAQKMKEHQRLSRKGAEKKFAGGLADHSEQTIKGHTATHLLHQALRDVLGKKVHQTGSNITVERTRFDFSFDRKLTDEEIKRVEDIVNEKIKQNLAVSFKIMSVEEAKKLEAIGLFEEKYGDKVKIYTIGPSTRFARSGSPFSREICGGPHVDFTGRLKRFKIIKQENIGGGRRRIYAVLEE